MDRNDMLAILVDYMSAGFLENIIALFKTDPALFELIPAMLAEENMRVRLGTAALVEELARDHRRELQAAVPGLIGLLQDERPYVRGDAAYLLGMLREPGTARALRERLLDADPGVREIAQESLAALEEDA